MERLTKRDEYGFAYIRGTDIIDMEEQNDEAIERLADYEDAEEQGRLIELPLAYGEHIFEAYENGHKVIEWTVEGFSIKPDSTYICIGHGVSINAAHLGDTLFHTREEAEAKLKELSDQDGEK